VSKYCNALKALPRDLLLLVQQHVAGRCVYVPRQDIRAGWGTKSGARKLFDERNAEIRRLRTEGVSVEQLQLQFHLSQSTVRKILRAKNSSTESVT
jgi:DNA invertase Pin-like site-specific DNA recombinase